ncbi:hypothetical protein VTN77DRAFT_2318 [Rasamsonia byssochlamydoides]|uniref:uncharacterized protein n=1 Tax=Rasamsonia byssochlamydoides TaxID=89139 RepID=UPI003742A6C5
MATLASFLPDLPLEQLALYHAMDPYLSSVLVFHGPVATANATVSSSRIQAHIFTAAGFKSYPRITVSPAAPLYAAVNHLPREKQGDEICRGLAVSLLKYFNELSTPVKECLEQITKAGKPSGRVPKMFEETHAADLANRMAKIENTAEIVRDLRDAYRERKVPWIDVDVVLPPGSISQQPETNGQGGAGPDEAIDDHQDDERYGKFSPIVQAFGDPIFLPTSRLRRAPSQPTHLSKSKVFTRSQKESLRLAMCEVVDTEERYVSKLYDLVYNVVEEFRQKARTKAPSSTSPDETALAKLFPPCLNEILEVNMGFLEVIRQVLEETEQDALADIAEETDLQSSRALAKQGKDAMGSIAFANALLEWFPRFSKPYAEYMRAHTGFTQTLNTFLKDNKSSFSRRVYETGEQKLRSLLMEPVQRLPRYSLLIDTMTSNLPAIHPAVKPFLKARDIIKDICSLDNPANTDYSQSLKRVMNMVEFWPPSVAPAGRLITAVDANELVPPYRTDAQEYAFNPTLMLLYKNYLVLLSKMPGTNMTARGLLSDLEKQAISVNDRSMSQGTAEFRFIRAFDLDRLRCLQSACGRIVYLMPATRVSSGTSQSTRMHALELSGMYEGRASRFIEEIVKAKIEGRFSERERESEKWTLRSPSGTSGNLGILASIFEDDPSGEMNRTGYSNIRIVFDTPKAVRTKTLDNSSVEAVVSVSSVDDNQYKVEIDAVAGAKSTADIVAADTFIPVLSKRLCNLLLPLHQPQNSALTETIVYSNFDILRQVASHILAQTKVPRSFRPPSPTKLISTLWGGGSQTKDPPSPSKAFNPNAFFGEVPKITPPKVNAVTTTPSTPVDETAPKISIVAPSSANQEDHLRLLEQTFSAYILALRSRSGNIVGRTLRSRGNADRAMVNELYNVLLEDPGKLQAAAEVPVDVLFVAFETFILHAWKDEIGPILSHSALKTIQSKFDSLFPGEFEVFFRKMLGEMSPQNRRALAAMIRLLAELLEASGNDGDRGALTAAFAEILTEDDDPMQHISLLDRLVDDFDNLFDDSTPSAVSHENTPSNPFSASVSSVNSNSSSFRKRFGFSLNSSRSDGESKVSSLIRSLSKGKNTAGDSEPKVSLFRSRSTDTDTRMAELLRPGSRDRPTIYGAFPSEESIRRPGSADNDSSVSGSIDESSWNSNKEPVRARRKRRSSLSDLPRPSTPMETPAISPIEPLKLSPKPRPQPEVLTRPLRPRKSPGSGLPTKLPQSPRSPTRPASPTQPASPIRSGSPIRKENCPPRSTLTERAINIKTEGPSSPTLRRKKRSDALSSIPQPTKIVAAKERPVTTYGPETPAKPEQAWSSPQKPQRLRMQSPQKLRDRLLNERRARAAAEAAFQAELEHIGEEISALKLSPTQSKQNGSNGKATSASSPNSVLASRLGDLESRFSTFCTDVGNRTAALERDLETSLIVSERRVKKLDELYREASAENEALYERFNDELSKLVKDIRMGNGEEALKTQLREALEEISRVKKENLRLKREVSGLRAQQVEASPPVKEGGDGREA